ncbi:hypothetical protein BTJ68_06059, partial [Hortaea werneckii EXF-2000]
MSSIVPPEVEAAKQRTQAAITSAKDATSSGIQKAREDPQAAKRDFLHSSLMRAALPFINGGAAGMVATT